MLSILKVTYDVINVLFSFLFSFKAIVTRPVIFKDEVSPSLITRVISILDRLLLPFAFKVVSISDYHYRVLASDYNLSNLYLIKNGASCSRFKVPDKLRFVPKCFSQ